MHDVQMTKETAMMLRFGIILGILHRVYRHVSKLLVPYYQKKSYLYRHRLICINSLPYYEFTFHFFCLQLNDSA